MMESRYRLSYIHNVDESLQRLGELNGRSKLTESKVKVIIARYAKGGVTQAYLAKHFNVSQQRISMIVRNNSWKR